MNHRIPELIALTVVLATGVTLIALGVTPESLAVVTAALAALYLAWHGGRPGPTPPRQEEQEEADRSREP
ncbi:hypothetical protein AB0L41_27430 [Amycolatopsis mediterranei]|uniref:hypothetical protein n=1 Tax=Amycolatopsis mediterranei TaxID=33910 RepID=UPI00344A309D